MLTDEERKALVANKVRRSRETWAEAKGIIESKYWHAAANRMYYASYYMVSALLLKNGQSSHTHGGTIGLFGLHFIKIGIVSSDMGKFYSELYELRQTGDYDDWKVVTEADIMPLVPTVEVFLDTLESVIRRGKVFGLIDYFQLFSPHFFSIPIFFRFFAMSNAQ